MDGALKPDPLGRIIAFAVLDPLATLHDTLLHGGDDIIEDGIKFMYFYLLYRFFGYWSPKQGHHRFLPQQQCLLVLVKVIVAMLLFAPVNFLADELGGLFDSSSTAGSKHYPLVIDIMGDVAEDILKVPLYAVLGVTVFMTIGETSP